MRIVKSAIYFCLFFVISCEQSSLKMREKAEFTSMAEVNNSHYVSLQEAKNNVIDFLFQQGSETRSLSSKTIINSFSKGGPQSKLEDEYESPLIHVFNFADDKGFVIAAGDDRMPQILCYVESGNLAEKDTIRNPGLIVMLSLIDVDYRMAIGLPVIDSDGNVITPDQYGFSDREGRPETKVEPAYSNTTPWHTNVTIGTPISCEWEQEDPFNAKCFTMDGRLAYAGCVPIAVAQIMYYWGHDCVYNGRSYDWDEMRTITDANVNTSMYATEWDSVQSLIAALGNENNLVATYGAVADSIGTFASSTYVGRTFYNFDYTDIGTLTDYNLEELKTSLASGPVIGFGLSLKQTIVTTFLGIPVSTDVQYSGGHAWVFDNYLERGRMRFWYDGNNTIIRAESEVEKLVHCNMGFGGEGNGYYYPGVYDSNNPVTRAQTVTVEGTPGYYRFQLKMHKGINP